VIEPQEDITALPLELIEEQMHIGWGGICQGFLGKGWRQFYQSHMPHTRDLSKQTERWMRTLILSMWEYSKAAWKHRNEIVH
jgi:hypothetical protein